MTIARIVRASAHSWITCLALSACATATRVTPEELPGGAVSVLIHNHGTAAAIISECRRDDDCTRITSVASGETQAVEIPVAARLAVRHDGDTTRFMTGPLEVRTGDRPVVSIESVVSRSSLTIERRG